VPETPAPPTLEDIRAARERIAPIARVTPLIQSDQLTALAGIETHVKLESLQRTGSFKIRGAYNKIAQLPEEARRRGVICASAGNHGQGVALSAKRLGAPAWVVMPEDAAYTKVKAIRALGAEVVLTGASYDDAYARALELRAERGLTFVHAYDDPDVIAGQGTIGLELLEALPSAGTVVVPIGGGGLMSGIALAVKALRPGTRIIGVVAAEANGTLVSFRRGERIRPEEAKVGHTIADGIRVKRPGELTFPVIKSLVDDVVEVTEDEIGDAIFTLLQTHKVAVEGAGAAGTAAILARKGRLVPPVCAVICGGNIDLNLLTHAIERGLTAAGTYLAFATRVPDRAGELFRLLSHLAAKKASVLDIEHRRTGVKNPFGVVEIEIVVEVRDPDHGAAVLDALRASGYDVWKMS
jgi:threonine dehydratase